MKLHGFDFPRPKTRKAPALVPSKEQPKEEGQGVTPTKKLGRRKKAEKIG